MWIPANTRHWPVSAFFTWSAGMCLKDLCSFQLSRCPEQTEATHRKMEPCTSSKGPALTTFLSRFYLKLQYGKEGKQKKEKRLSFDLKHFMYYFHSFQEALNISLQHCVVKDLGWRQQPAKARDTQWDTVGHSGCLLFRECPAEGKFWCNIGLCNDFDS